MEFRCRVATTTGQILETTYVAESETRLRSELENVRGELSDRGAQTRLIGESPGIRRVHDMIAERWQSDAS